MSTQTVALSGAASMLPFLAADHQGLVNSIPETFGHINADGLFPAEGLSTSFVRIDILNGVIRALPVTPGGRPSTIAGRKANSGIVLEIPNVSHEDSVLAGDIRDWLALAARMRDPEAYDEALVNKIEYRHKLNRLKFDVTLEVMKMGALQGKIIDGEGTELYNLFTVFGISQRVVYFDLDNTNADIPAKIEAVFGGTEDAMIDDVMDGVEARVDPVFYNKLIGHPSVQKYYQNTPAMLEELLNQRRQRQNGQSRRRINIGGVEFIEYRQKVTLWGSDTPTKLIVDGEGFAIPTGTMDSHKTFAAPPLDIRELDGTAASVDDLIHMTTEVMKHGAGEEWKYQMNALPVWKRPGTLTKLSSAAS